MTPHDITLPMYAVVVLVAGILACFFGRRLFRVVLGLVGFLAGAALAGGVTAFFVDSEVTQLVVAAIGGALGAVGLVTAYYVGVFLVGAASGLALGGALGAGFDPTWLQVAITVACSIAGGLLALKIQEVFLAVATAIIGSAAMVGALVYLVFGGETLYRLRERVYIDASWGALELGVLGIGVLLAVLGTATQLGAGKKRDD